MHGTMNKKGCEREGREMSQRPPRQHGFDIYNMRVSRVGLRRSISLDILFVEGMYLTREVWPRKTAAEETVQSSRVGFCPFSSDFDFPRTQVEEKP